MSCVVYAVVLDLNYVFGFKFNSVSNTSWNYLGNTSEKKHISWVALMSLLLLMGTEVSPFLRPSIPIMMSMKSSALTLLEPWHVIKAKIFKANRSISMLSEGSTLLLLVSYLLLFYFWVARLIFYLDWCLMRLQSGPVWIQIIYSTVGSNLTAINSFNSGIWMNECFWVDTKDGGGIIPSMDRLPLWLLIFFVF